MNKKFCQENMKSNKFIQILVISLPFIILGFFGLIGNRARERFYNSKIDAKIIDSSNRQKRTCKYYLPNDLQINITAVDTFKLLVGDSISKNEKSWKYKVFRKKKLEKNFRFINSYKMEE
ncbi:hypothetical protein [Flavobacterium foetidum]|uniref:hypothetical protein n=1 Tax=Flavobacterium foetidum TaxID=2026681 RepID=UPI001074A423|nr:hypothetical protein [Flavobacterium foetidum]KAF2514250.1 hypothetical protein E0W73_12655 [Flavobacterium foetidum]